MSAPATTCRIGAGSGFWGDMIDPAVELVERGDVAYCCFDLLAELTVAILARSRQRDPSKGHIPDLEQILRETLPAARRNGTRIITNGGGANPAAGALAAARVAAEVDPSTRIATIAGDEFTDRVEALRGEGWKFANLDTGEEDIDRIADRIVAANAYTGADSVIAALSDDADVVIGGRLSDSALYCGPLMHEFGWTFDDAHWDRIGAALTVGHVLECGALSTGGMSSQWRLAKDPWRLGFPIAEVAQDGSAVITKVDGSGGIVNEYTVKEHLLYEVHDPANYLLPDAVVDLMDVEVQEVGPDRVRITGMRARPRPDTLKVQIGYEDGYVAESRAYIPAPETLEKADHCVMMVRERLRHLGVEPLETRFDRVGIDALAGAAAPPLPDGYEPNEIELRMVVRTATRAEAQIARRALLVATAGPVGVVFTNPPPVRKVIGLWPTLVPREAITETVSVETAGEVVAGAGA
jgi:hypothetical protein